MTSTRASAVPRSRINRGGCCHAAPPRRARRNTVRPRLASPRWSAGAGAAGCRVRRSRRGPMWRSGRGVLAGPAAEEAEEIAFRRQDERGVLAVQRIAIGLQRAVKGKEFFVLPERIGIDLDRLTVAVAAHPLRFALRLGENDGALAFGVGADLLRRLGAFAAILRGLLLTLGLHAGIDGLAVFFRQIGAAQPHIDDINAEILGLHRDIVADLHHDRGDGDGQSIKIYADAFGQDKEFFAFYRSLQAYRDALNGKDTSFVLSPEGNFFRFFGGWTGENDAAALHHRIRHD